MKMMSRRWHCFQQTIKEAYLHHYTVWGLLHPCNVLSVSGAVQAAMLDLLALQFHGCRAGTDYVNRFLESDALQGSISWNGVTDIFIELPRLRKRQKQGLDQGGSEVLHHRASKIKTF